MRRNILIFRLVQFCLIGMPVISLVACQQTVTRDVAPIIKNDQYAKQLYLSGNFHAAAQEYLALAKSVSLDKQPQYQLSAVNALLKGNKIEHAKKIITALKQKQLNGEQNILKNIYTAQILLAEGSIDSAYKHLLAHPPGNMSASILAQFYQTKATVLYSKGKFLTSAKDRLQLSSYLQTAQEINKNYQAIWQALSRLSYTQIEEYLRSDVGEIRSWLELALTKITAIHNKDNFSNLIEEWQQKYPNHPASHNISENIIDHFQTLTKLPLQIALLLPFNSIYNDAAVAIREGFMAAWYEQREYKPIIKIYETSVSNIVAVYQRAINEGADFVVGPLQKKVISKLVETHDTKVTTLLLNLYQGKRDIAAITSDALALPVFRQFYISPEEKARQVAERSWFDGHARAIIFKTENKLSSRISSAFAEHWQQLGGTVLNSSNIKENLEDIKSSVKNVLNIEQSIKRGKLLHNRLGINIKATPRRRDDIDLIFMAVSPVLARRLVPELRFHETKDIAFYATSYIYTANLDRRLDYDLDGIIFNDMPWVIESKYKYSSLNRALEKAQKNTYTHHRRLYAFGIDVYQIIPEINWLIINPTERYQGKTGLIQFPKEGKANRKLIWSQFIDGKPEPYNIVDLN